MKKHLILATALLVTVFSHAQKKELKTLAKALKSSNFAEAKSVISTLEPMLGAMDAKTKAKYYLAKGQAFFAKGAGSNADIKEAVAALGNLGTGKEASNLKALMEQDLFKKANTAFSAKNYKESAQLFSNLHGVKPADLEYLFYAAYSALQGGDYDSALKDYSTLLEKKYTGIKTQYFATNKATGKEIQLTKSDRDKGVKLGAYSNPREAQTKSQVADMIKNVIFIYNKQNNTDGAIEALKKARTASPDDVDLIISEANLYLKLKDDAKFKSLMEEAVAKQPNNAVLHYNIGVVNMGASNLSAARESFNKALSLDPSYSDATINLSTSYINEGNALIEQMNALGNSSADNAKYDELKAQKASLFRVGAETLETFISKNANADKSVAQQLFNIYNALGDATDKANALKAKFGL